MDKVYTATYHGMEISGSVGVYGERLHVRWVEVSAPDGVDLYPMLSRQERLNIEELLVELAMEERINRSAMLADSLREMREEY